ncbi:MAG: PilZ domain-containing protein [Candidatus Accumulibacter sp.]|jgi:hypothetical protein|nr:PilZ domain-containing protein [Accumulibacter sp.]
MLSFFGFGRDDSSSGRGGLDRDRIGKLIEFFPIGRKLRYYPEFNEDIVLDTLIVAYCANGHLLYSMDSVEIDGDGLPASFSTDDGKVSVPAGRLTTFQLLVPDTSDLERKLDYVRRAQISRNGQFSAGNNITLMANAGHRGASTLDTEVARQVVLKNGPYMNRNMVLLTPDLATLSITDQRRKPRTRINVPATAHLPVENYSGPCTLVDISDAEMRVRISGRGTAPEIHEGDALIIDIRLGKAERRYSISGPVLRCAAGACVVEISGEIRDGRFVSFSPLDLLELKAGLLNHGR